MRGRSKKGKRKRGRPQSRFRRGRTWERRLKALRAHWRQVVLNNEQKARGLLGLAVGILALLLGLIFAGTGRLEALYWTAVAAGSVLAFIGAWSNWQLGLTAAFVYAQPLLIYLGNTSYIYTKAAFSLGVISLLLALWGLELIRSQRDRQDRQHDPRGAVRLQLTGLRWPALLVLVAALLSLLNAPEFLADFQYVVLLVYFGSFFLWVANRVRRLEEARLLVGALLASGALASVYALLQYFGLVPGAPDQPDGSWAILSTFGHKNYLGGFLAYLFVPGMWLLYTLKGRGGRLFVLSTLALIFTTLVAIDSDSAWLAFVLAVGVWLVGLVLLRDLSRLRGVRAWNWGLIGLALALSAALELGTLRWVEGSHPKLLLASVGLGALALLTLAAELAAAWGRLIASAALRRGLALGAVALALLVGVGAAAVLPATPFGQQWIKTFQRISAAPLNTLLTREVNWVVGYEMFRDSPLIGIGLGDYKREYLEYRAKLYAPLPEAEGPGGKGESRGSKPAIEARFGLPRTGDLPADQAHNEYVQIAAEMGTLGVLATLAVFVGIGRVLKRRLRQPHTRPLAVRWDLLAAFAGIVAFASDSLFSFPLHLPANALALVTLLGLLCAPAFGPWEGVVTLSTKGARFLGLLLVAISIVVSVFTVRDWEADRLLNQALEMRVATEAELVDLLERSIRLDVAPSASLYLLGAVKVLQGEVKEGHRLLERSFHLIKRGYSYLLLAATSFELGDIRGARRYLDALLALRLPGREMYQAARELQARILIAEGRPQEALPILKELLRHGYPPEAIYADLGEAYLKQGDRGEAEKHLKNAQELLQEALTGKRASGLTRSQLQALQERVERLLQELKR